MCTGLVQAMCTVLIIDDNEEHREIAREVLTTSGHHTQEAENGKVALEWLRTNPEQLPCIALVDLMMPVMDGWDFLAALHREPKWAGIKVIVFSARVRKNEAPPVLRASAYWPKPPASEQLERIQRWCPRHEPPRPSDA
jgi:CheY-like chemotaxis protein